MRCFPPSGRGALACSRNVVRSEEHTSELQSQSNLVCRLLLEKKKKKEHLHTRLCLITSREECHGDSRTVLSASLIHTASPGRIRSSAHIVMTEADPSAYTTGR